MVRIGGGVFPDIKEPDYLGQRGYTIDDQAGKVSSSHTACCLLTCLSRCVLFPDMPQSLCVMMLGCQATCLSHFISCCST